MWVSTLSLLTIYKHRWLFQHSWTWSVMPTYKTTTVLQPSIMEQRVLRFLNYWKTRLASLYCVLRCTRFGGVRCALLFLHMIPRTRFWCCFFFGLKWAHLKLACQSPEVTCNKTPLFCDTSCSWASSLRANEIHFDTWSWSSQCFGLWYPLLNAIITQGKFQELHSHTGQT